MAKNPPIYLVCQTIGNQTHPVSQYPTEAQALAALARIEQADPHGTYIAAVVQDLRRAPSVVGEGKA